MKKKILAALLCVIMVLALLPVTAFADTPTGVFVAGTELVAGKKYVNSEGGITEASSTNYNVLYADGVLYLNGLTVTDSEATESLDSKIFTYAIFSRQALTINVSGDSTVSTAAVEGEQPNIALGVYGNLTIEGDGKLTATAGSSDTESVGVQIVGDLTVSGGTLIGNGGATGSVLAGNATSIGVYPQGAINVSGGSLTGNGGTATATEKGYSAGVAANSIAVSGGSLTGNSNAAEANFAQSYGIVTGTMDIQGGTIKATGGNATGKNDGTFSYGVKVATDDEETVGDIFVAGGSLTATGGRVELQDGGLGGIQSVGLYAKGSITVQSGTLTATGGKAIDGSSEGLYAKGSITVQSGTLTAIGGEAKEYSYGVSSANNAISAIGGSLIAKTTGNTGTCAALNSALTLGSGVEAKGSTSADGSSPVAYVRSVNNEYKWVSVTKANITPGGYDYAPSDVTVYNGPSAPNATIWLTGSGLTAGDQLVTERNPSGSAYRALEKLAGSNDVFATYSIGLKSGSKSTGGAMNLTFDLNEKFAGQDFTLVHQKANNTYESFYAAADAKGDLSFGPLYELSPFMLVKGRLNLSNVGVPDTGESVSPLLWTGIALLGLLGLGAAVYFIKRKRA